jgi:2',3'-cyclic-nucleotide 2'-phosphodiesterase (5'-nucleotidase family)
MENFTLQLFHFADQEAGIPAIEDAPRFSAVLEALKLEDLDGDGEPGFANTLILSSGDAYIPGAFFSASQLAFGAPGRADILIQNELGVQAIAFGNHEFDLGTSQVQELLVPSGSYPGALFPYLSGNLDFSTDSALRGLVVADGQEASDIPGKIAASTIITVSGEKIGIVGATTPTLRAISSPGDVGIFPTPFDAQPTPDQLDALAAIIQADVDALLAANPDMNKVILLAHMQQLNIELELASRLRNVDIIVAGGSDTRLVDENDRLRAGDTPQGTYPIFVTDADGFATAVVNTDANYKYVGRLVIEFDANGNIIPDSYNPLVSGAYATDDQGVADLNAEDLINPAIQDIVDAIADVIATLDGNILGQTAVYLNGLRQDVRSQETNLGNLTADANLAYAKTLDDSTVISIKNGGGIRSPIGFVSAPAGSTNPDDVERLPPAANPLAGKEAGDISQLDVADSLRFNNSLSLVTVTAQELLAVVEHGVAGAGPGLTPGAFPQVGGIKFSFDPTLPARARVQTLVVVDEQGRPLDFVVRNGEVVGDPNRTFRMVTLSFLAGGGDGYPFPSFSNLDRVDLLVPEEEGRTGAATFANDGTEQDALAEYLIANFSAGNPFNQPDTPAALDVRIQNLLFRADSLVNLGTLLGGQFTEVVGLGETLVLSGFGGIGTGISPAADTVAEADTIQFVGEGLTARNMLLTQIGSDLQITFEGIDSTRVTLENFQLENLDNLTRATGAAVDLANILFDGETAVTDSFDVFNADWNFGQIFNRNSVTFLNDLDNVIRGFADSDDVINGQGGDDIIYGVGGNNILRGGEGNDRLYGGAGNDILVGGEGNDWLDGGAGDDILIGGEGRDIFVIAPRPGVDTIVDFEDGIDLIGLSGGLAFSQLSITQGTGDTSADTLISDSSNTVLAILRGVEATAITSSDFLLVG